MKKSLLILSLGLMGLSALAQNPTTFNCVADTWVRQNNVTWNSGEKQDKLEIRMDAIKDGDNVIGYAYFLGLLGFDYSLPSGQKVSSATLRLVTERWKGSNISVYGYSNNFAENTNWETEETYIQAALDGTPVKTFQPNGQRNKAFTSSNASDALDDEYKALDKWTNEIDVTDYLRTIPATTTRVNFMLTPSDADSDNPSINQNCFYSKDATGVVNGNDASLEFTQAEIIPVLYVTFVEDSNSSVETLDSAADTYVRSDAQNQRYDSKEDMEIKNIDGGATFFGLLKFNLPYELLSGNYNVQGATLRLVTTQNKGDRNINIYDLGDDFEETVKYETIGSSLETLVANSTPVASFSAAGQGNMAMGDYATKDNFDKDNYGTVNAWTNTIDLTDHVAAKAKGTRAADGIVTLVIAKANTHSEAMKFATKEAVSIGSTSDGVYFDAKDLVPQLTVAYTKAGSSEVETLVIGASDNAPVEYYDLSGRRVANPDKGVYIMRQGEKTVKVIK